MADDSVFERLLSSVRELRPLIAVHQQEADTSRRLPDPIAEAFFERDLIRVQLPLELGGAGLDVVSWLRLTEEIASYDGSVAWNFSIGSTLTGIAAELPPDMAGEMFGTPRVFVCASGSTTGEAIAVEGGYRVTGHWTWASGVHQATWVMGRCRVFDGAEPRLDAAGAPVFIQAVAPAASASLLDVWHVGGMKGTGSTDFILDDVFVPNELALPGLGSWTLLFGVPFATCALGIGRCSIEALIELARDKAGSFTRSPLQERPAVQYDVAKAQAMLESARENLFDAAAETVVAAESGRPSDSSRARLRRAAVHAAETSAQVVALMYRAAGGSALFESGPFERCLRDVHAILGQVMLQREIMEDAGRVAFGLKPKLPMF